MNDLIMNHLSILKHPRSESFNQTSLRDIVSSFNQGHHSLIPPPLIIAAIPGIRAQGRGTRKRHKGSRCSFARKGKTSSPSVVRGKTKGEAGVEKRGRSKRPFCLAPGRRSPGRRKKLWQKEPWQKEEASSFWIPATECQRFVASLKYQVSFRK